MLSQGWTYPYIKVAAAGQSVTHMRSQQQTTTIQSIPNNKKKKLPPIHFSLFKKLFYLNICRNREENTMATSVSCRL